MADALKYRHELGHFLDDAEIPLDKNAAERALRIVAISRNNLLHDGHSEGVQNLAVLQSNVIACQVRRVNPDDYIRDVLLKSKNRESVSTTRFRGTGRTMRTRSTKIL